MAKAGFVAIVGRPNAGKSTLLNRILGTELSIVTPKAQTTRERVLGILTEAQGQIVFVDTPGIHRANPGGINEYMVREAREALDGPTLVWYLVDPRSGLNHEAPVLDLLQKSGTPVFVLLNKTDLVGNLIPREVEDRMEGAIRSALEARKIQVEGIYKISAKGGNRVEALLEETWKHIPEGPAFYDDPDQLSDRPTRFFVAEKIREQLYMALGEELPYSCGVEIDRFDESSKPPRIEATIYVERESQKGMVIGKSGHKVKEIGSAARRRIETFTGGQVFLGLRVKVLPEWTRDPEAMKRFGYNSK
jgi:GTP-binding protein Era